MPNGGYIRKYKEERPVVAICYDFDKTLSPDDMQAQGFIQAVGYEISKFWQESNGLAGSNDMDQNLAYMFKMMETAECRVLSDCASMVCGYCMDDNNFCSYGQ